jgi:hypothetical protein
MISRRNSLLGAALSACFWVCPAGADRSGAIAATAPAPAGVQAAAHEIAAVSVKRAVDALGRPGGFYLTPKYHIPLPGALDRPVKTLTANYAITLPQAVERAINRAAEATAGPAGEYILKALPGLKLADPRAGPDDAVTAALKAEIGKAFHDAMRPVFDAALTQAGGDAALQAMQARYETLTGAPFPNFDLRSYALDAFVNTFLAAVAAEEENMRLRPSLRTTEALRRAFGQ